MTAPELKVKPLVWEYREQQFGTYRADEGRYWVNQQWGSDIWYFATVDTKKSVMLYDGDYLEAAKAAAQADYEARILSAIEIVEEPK